MSGIRSWLYVWWFGLSSWRFQIKGNRWLPITSFSLHYTAGQCIDFLTYYSGKGDNVLTHNLSHRWWDTGVRQNSELSGNHEVETHFTTHKVENQETTFHLEDHTQPRSFGCECLALRLHTQHRCLPQNTYKIASFNSRISSVSYLPRALCWFTTIPTYTSLSQYIHLASHDLQLGIIHPLYSPD